MENSKRRPKIKPAIVRSLLAILNSRWINHSPCLYAYVGNVDNFSIGHLRSEVKQRPELTVAELIREAEPYGACKIGSGGDYGFSVIENGEVRDATVWDYGELRDLGGRAASDVSKPRAIEEGESQHGIV